MNLKTSDLERGLFLNTGKVKFRTEKNACKSVHCFILTSQNRRLDLYFGK